MARLILASQSPRRRELLLNAGISHTVRVTDVDESVMDRESAVDYVRRVAQDKAFAVEPEADEIVLAADTIVVCEGLILGKPQGVGDAARMLRILSAKAHDVITGVCLRAGDKTLVEHEITRVWFGPLDDVEIFEYLASGEPMDKAGAYAIQGLASRYVESIEGSYSNVVGLPVALVWRLLKSLTRPS